MNGNKTTKRSSKIGIALISSIQELSGTVTDISSFSANTVIYICYNILKYIN